MRELRVREPWANLAFTSSEEQKLEDLLARVQILEARIRELEVEVATQPERAPRETVSV